MNMTHFGANIHVTPDGVRRVLGLIPTRHYDADRRPAAPAAGDGPIVAPEEYESWPAELHPLDQGTWNACTYFSSVQALMYARHESGQPFVLLDPLYPYLRETGGRNSGTNILLAAKRLMRDGAPPLAKTQSTDVDAAAARFRFEFAESLTSYDQLLSEVARRRPVVGSVYVGPSYSNLDAEGAMGCDRGTANHAIFLGGGLRKSARHGWMIRHCGSWGTRWGQGGFGWYCEAHFDAAGYGEAYTLQAVTEDAADGDDPPAVTEAA